MFRVPDYSAPSGESTAPSICSTPAKRNVYAEEKDPFDALRRASETSEEVFSDGALSPGSTWSNSTRPSSSPSPFSPGTPMFNIAAPVRRPIVKAKTFPSQERSPRFPGTGPEGLGKTLPGWMPLDEQAKTFRLQAPFVYASQSRNLPQYHIQQVLDRDGGPSSLNIRRVQPHETRSCSVPALHAGRGRRMRYNEDETLYTLSDFDMKGRGGSALEGSIQLTTGKTLWGGQWTRIWHVTKCRAQHHGCNYRGTCEPEKRLLFCVKKGVWEDADGVVVGREERGSLGSLGLGALLRDKGQGVKMRAGCWML